MSRLHFRFYKPAFLERRAGQSLTAHDLISECLASVAKVSRMREDCLDEAATKMLDSLYDMMALERQELILRVPAHWRHEGGDCIFVLPIAAVAE